MRAATATRLLLGSLCLAAPSRVLAAAGGQEPASSGMARIVRVLGTRWVLQAGLDVLVGQRARRLDVAIELSHAGSMVPAAAVWPAHRRAALSSAAVAVGVALLDISERPGGRLVIPAALGGRRCRR